MKVSHRELEACRAGPLAWVQARLSGGSTFSRFGYNQALLNAIRKYHKSGDDAPSARRHLKELIDRNFKNESRIDETEDALQSYISWHEASGTVVADTNIRLSYGIGGYLELGGLITRLDVIPTGYRAVLLGPLGAQWKSQLRMPLIQDAIAIKYGRPVSTVSVGIQDLDGGNLQQTTYTVDEIQRARADFRRLGKTIARAYGTS